MTTDLFFGTRRLPGRNALPRWLALILAVCAAAAVTAMEYFQLQLSSPAVSTKTNWIPTVPQRLLPNLCIVLALNLLLVLIFRTWRRSLLISSGFCLIWSLVNYYVCLFHGSPMFPSELANTVTALNVAGSYSYSITNRVLLLGGLFAGELLLILLAPFSGAGRTRTGWLCHAGCLVAAVVYLMSFLSGYGTSGGWNVWEHIKESGFLLCSVQDVRLMLSPITQPQDYDPAALAAPALSDPEPELLPDIIVILNESFYDPAIVTDIDPDRDYLTDFFAVGGKTGCAVMPGTGGGTNDAEFELLTSKSTYLLNAKAPFNYINFRKAGSSIVQYLHTFGYTAAAMHSEPGINYRRNTAYPAMGFDQVYMGFNDLGEETVYIYDREGSDAFDYSFLLSHHDPQAQPQLMYLLTFQNHGGYDQNDDALDTVHARADLGTCTSEVNEFLSSIALSAESFRAFLETLTDWERPVVVCMVGDHAPSFVTQLPAREGLAGDALELSRRTTPYILWSNYPLDFSQVPDRISATALLPWVLRCAGFPMTAFYQQILDMTNEFPVFTGPGIYVNSAGETGRYNPSDSEFQAITDYLCMEYNSLIADSTYRSELFLP